MLSCTIYTTVTISFILKSPLGFIMLLYLHCFLAHWVRTLYESIFGQVYAEC